MIKISELRLVIDRTLIAYLLRIDVEEAERVRCHGCPYCGSRLHRADYPRKPRGIDELTEDDWWRISFCCENCRRRTTPKSVRFLGRKVYAAVVVVVSCLLRAEGELIRRVHGRYGAAGLTIRRWVKWWEVPVLTSLWWREARAYFMPPADEATFLSSLCRRFHAASGSLRAALRRLLQFVSPLTVPAAYPS